MYKKEYDRLKRPVCAFVTFKTIKGSQIAKQLLHSVNKQGQYPQLFGDRIKVERADNPSDIRWTNK